MNTSLNQKVLTGANIDDIFSQVETDINAKELFLSYHAIVDQPPRQVTVDIDIDPGGGFESGFSTTILAAPLLKEPAFNFVIYHQGVMAEIGKFFGMQDVETGYEEFDRKVIVKSSHPAAVSQLFDDKAVRSVFGDLTAFQLSAEVQDDENNGKRTYLLFNIERAMTDVVELKRVYIAFCKVLARIDPVAEILRAGL